MPERLMMISRVIILTKFTIFGTAAYELENLSAVPHSSDMTLFPANNTLGYWHALEIIRRDKSALYALHRHTARCAYGRFGRAIGKRLIAAFRARVMPDALLLMYGLDIYDYSVRTRRAAKARFSLCFWPSAECSTSLRIMRKISIFIIFCFHLFRADAMMMFLY